MTTDYGKTWRRITGGLPEDGFVRVVREDPARRGLLYAGTETGVFVSFDDGGRWQPLRMALPGSSPAPAASPSPAPPSAARAHGGHRVPRARCPRPRAPRRSAGHRRSSR